LSAAARRTGDSPISDLMARALAAPELISLAAGFVDHSTLPAGPTAHAVERLLTDDVEGRRALQYGTTRGDLKLRHRLIERMVAAGELAPERAGDAQHRTVVTTGSQQLLYLLCEALVDPGDIVLVESPTYFVFLGVLQAFGARTIGIATDEGGLRIDALEATLARLEAAGELGRVKFIYSIGEHSNPTGLSLAPERRPALVAAARRWSRDQAIYVVEDAAYRGLTFEGDEPASVWSHDPSGELVVHARTFSKTFSPGLKTGWGILPESLLGPVLNAKGNHDFGSAHFNGQLLEALLADGSVDRQVATLQALYRRKRDAMLGALDRELGGLRGEGVSWTHPKGGLYVWLTLPEGLDTGRDGAFFARCLEHGVLYVPGALAYPGEPGPPPGNGARLSYGVAGVDGIAEGIRRLAAAVTECLDPVG
jgi:2-aminoadipate transaminase